MAQNRLLSTTPLKPITRVIVADPYPIILKGLRKIVEDDARFRVVAEVSTMAALWEKVMAERPEVALVDWWMASRELEAATELLRSERHATSIVFMTMSEAAQEQQEILRLGASGVLSKWSSAQELRMTVQKAHKARWLMDGAVEATVGAATNSRAGGERRIQQLTHRERQIIPLVCSGLRNKEIAEQLGISESTVWHHLTSVFTKLGVEDRIGLAAFAYCHRLVLPATPREPEARLGGGMGFPLPA